MEKYETNPPLVVIEDCIGCGRCVAVCPSFVLDMTKGKSEVVRGHWCIGCGHCGAVCPTGAILHEGICFDTHPQKGEVPAISPEALGLLLRERRSVRNYTTDSVPEDALKKIFDAGRYAPTGTNSQNVHYVVLNSQDRIEELRRMTIHFYDKIFSRARGRLGPLLISLIAGRKTAAYLRSSLPKVEYANELMKQGKDPLFYHAPVVILTHAESWDPCSSFNCSVALYHCSLMAHTLGLGCCFNGFLSNAVNHASKIKQSLDIPPDHKCYSAMTLGYPNVKYLRLVHRDLPKVQDTCAVHRAKTPQSPFVPSTCPS
ncbi:MAG TPA: nitroreductase family protein [Thermodesulfobacteriota bacterium]|nr:nitroreductase family protein [Thermodesulfobacteriota bacterium]